MSERLAKLIAERTPVPAHRPWPRYEVDEAAWITVAQELGQGGGDLLGLWSEKDNIHLALRVTGAAAPCLVSLRMKNSEFPSVGRFHAPAIRLERAVRDLHGAVPFGLPDRRPWLDHGAWGVRAPLGPRAPSVRRNPAEYDFLAAR